MHNKRCLAKAVISAIENKRDLEGVTSQEFRGWVQNGSSLIWAEWYLDEGTVTCTCEV